MVAVQNPMSAKQLIDIARISRIAIPQFPHGLDSNAPTLVQKRAFPMPNGLALVETPELQQRIKQIRHP